MGSFILSSTGRQLPALNQPAFGADREFMSCAEGRVNFLLPNFVMASIALRRGLLLDARIHSFRRCQRPSFRLHRCLSSSPSLQSEQRPKTRLKIPDTIRENIYTLPNALTVSRILACPVLGWSILRGNFEFATSLLVYAGLTDLADGYLARRFKMRSVLGTILDPAADKTLMTTLTVTLSMGGYIPVPLAVIIIGRDVLLTLSAFVIRYKSLPEPKTFARYWDFGIPSVEVRPTEISKVNTALQLLLMGATTFAQLLPTSFALFNVNSSLIGLQWIVGATTIGSGLSYVFSSSAVRVLGGKRPKP